MDRLGRGRRGRHRDRRTDLAISARTAHPVGGGARHARAMGHEITLAAIKAVHTVAFFVIATCGLLVLRRIRGRPGRRTSAALAVSLAEVAVFVGNGFVCPLTPLAERYARGAARSAHLPARCRRPKRPGAGRHPRDPDCAERARFQAAAPSPIHSLSRPRPGGTPLPARLVALIPGYNEGPRIGPVVDATLRHLPVLVVDDGSATTRPNGHAPPGRRSSNSARTEARAPHFAWASNAPSRRATTRSSRSTPTASTTRPKSQSRGRVRGKPTAGPRHRSAQLPDDAADAPSCQRARRPGVSWAVGRPSPTTSRATG